MWGYVALFSLVWAGIQAGPGTPVPGTNQAIGIVVVVWIIVGLSKIGH